MREVPGKAQKQAQASSKTASAGLSLKRLEAHRQSAVGKVPGNHAEEIDKEEALQVAHSDRCQIINEHPMRAPLPMYPQVKNTC
jgi:hypothetical protein